jgi:hypothetical protein
MTKLTLKNDFHGTEVVLQIKLDAVKEGVQLKLSAGQAKKAQAALCGIADCTCSGHTGARGNSHDIDGQEVRLEIDPNQDSSATVRIIGVY